MAVLTISEHDEIDLGTQFCRGRNHPTRSPSDSSSGWAANTTSRENLSSSMRIDGMRSHRASARQNWAGVPRAL